MKQCYLVIMEWGGLYESYETPIKVFLTKENAEKFINDKTIPTTEDQLKISPEAYRMAEDDAMMTFLEDNITPFPELILKTGKYPEWSLEDLRETEEFVRRQDEKFVEYRIETLELCQ